MKEKFSGRFVVLDGPDGCGKTTQTRLLVQWLRGQGVEVESFREPGGTAIGEKIRQVLLDPEHIALSTPAEVMLYMAARVQLWAERIAPALKEKKCVVLDRWLCSTCAYQGNAGGFGMDKVIKIATDCLARPWPDLTIILDVDPKVAASRLKRDLDRMERKGDGYHQKVRQGFLELAARRKYFVVDASDDVEAVHKEVVEVIARADF
ncbi:MAG: dTMP kinase [Planctomycetota bacterium]